jgi:peptide/nickel transport system substrate-binding protein
MKHKLMWFGISLLLVASMLLASCGNQSTTTTTATATTTATTTTTTTTTVTSTTTGTSTAPVTTTTATTTTTGNWWDYQGTPQYGGTIVIGLNTDITQWDPYFTGGTNVMSTYLQMLHVDDWTLSPSIFAFQMIFRPPDYVRGGLALSWEMPDASTYIVHLRQNVYWQNIAPVNGRQFVASDVVWDMDRMYGLGGGFTTASPYVPSDVSSRATLASVTASGKFDVIFKWSSNNPEYILETMQDQGTSAQMFVAPEAVTQWGNLSDWHHAIGTGPFILSDFVSGSSATVVRNPSCLQVDERNPQNTLPYADSVHFLVIVNRDTALAALRAGKIDIVEGNSIQYSRAMKTSNPDVVQVTVAQAAQGFMGRNDVAPFNNIKVREAMQLAMNLPLIASTYYYGDVQPIPQTLTSSELKGWGFPYADWPQELKDQYAYNPTLAKQLLAQANLPNGFHTNIVSNSSSDQDLLQIIVSELSAINITMDIRLMDNVSWGMYCLTNKQYDQMTYCDGRPFGNAYSPMRQLKLFMTGFGGNYGKISDPVFDAFYPAGQAATDITAIKKVVSDANEWVARQHVGVSIVLPNTYSFVQPWLKGYNAQNGAVTSGFYLSRFWIDQTLKKSLGH